MLATLIMKIVFLRIFSIEIQCLNQSFGVKNLLHYPVMKSPNAGFKSIWIYLVTCVSIVTISFTPTYPKENQFYITTLCIIYNYSVLDVSIYM